MKTGIELIAEERQRQIDVEGYTKQHDSNHKVSEFVYAAIAYTEAAKVGVNCQEIGNTNKNKILMRKQEMGLHFPWGQTNFKPTTDIRDLIKAGALIAAAIDRLNNECNVENWILAKDLNGISIRVRQGEPGSKLFIGENGVMYDISDLDFTQFTIDKV